jgi:hypothetical protein
MADATYSLHAGQAISISAKIGAHLAKGFFHRMRVLSSGMQFNKHLAQASNLNLEFADAPVCDLRIRLRPLSAPFHDHGDGFLLFDLHLDLRLASAVELTATDAEKRRRLWAFRLLASRKRPPYRLRPHRTSTPR